MNIVTDRKYINVLRSRLDKFSQKKDNLYNFRCPLCGDSKKNLNKARGFLYVKKGGFYYKCHNCGVGTTLGKFIKEIDVVLYKQYITERWKSGENGNSNYEKPKFTFDPPVFKQTDGILRSKKLVRVRDLDDLHVAKQYFNNRGIVKLNDFYYAESWIEFVDDAFQEKYPDVKKAIDHSRIIIPFFDMNKNLTHIQGRTIDDNSYTQRYITLRVVEGALKVFGLDKINWNKTVYVVEGPFDSLFLPNCIAMGGGDCEHLDSIVSTEIGVVVMDNEPRSVDTVKRMERYIDIGYPICVWPEKIKEKDINDIFLSGMNSEKILDLINKNTYLGIGAKFALNTWRKC